MTATATSRPAVSLEGWEMVVGLEVHFLVGGGIHSVRQSAENHALGFQ